MPPKLKQSITGLEISTHKIMQRNNSRKRSYSQSSSKQFLSFVSHFCQHVENVEAPWPRRISGCKDLGNANKILLDIII